MNAVFADRGRFYPKPLSHQNHYATKNGISVYPCALASISRCGAKIENCIVIIQAQKWRLFLRETRGENPLFGVHTKNEMNEKCGF